jgi:amino acid transporter
MAVAALLATAGCTNATLYASGNLTEMLAELRLFPAFFGGGSRLGRNAGLLITTGLALIVANFVELGAIASVGSAVSLVVFLLVAGAGWARRRETGSNAAIILVSMAMIVVVLAFFFVDTIRNSPETFGAMIGVGVVAIVLDALCRRPLQPAVSNP